MNLPEQVGVMVLPQTVFFPHHLLPLRIFELRYREMLAKALESSRMFAVAMEDPGRPARRVGGLGLIRSCVQQPDGTSNLILQGLARVRLDHLLQVRPYVVATPEPLEDPSTITPAETVVRDALVAKILEHLEKIETPLEAGLQEMKKFLRHLEDHHALVDLVAGCFLQDPETRQTILETANLTERLRFLCHKISEISQKNGDRPTS
jgi:Lon protease-like protein